MPNKLDIPSRLLLGALFASLLFGQLFRLDLFSNSAGGILVSDALVLGVAISFIFQKKLWSQLRGNITFKWLAIWLAVLVLSYLTHFFHYHPKEMVVGFGYLIRLIAYYSLIPLGYLWLRHRQPLLIRYLVYLTVALIALGLVIRIVLPDFSVLVPLGWDPHVGRLTSTWLDPNYFGCFLAFVFTIFLAQASTVKNHGRYYFIAYLIFLLIIWVAIYNTSSRSALVAFFVGAMIVASQMSWKTVVLVLLLFSTSFVVPSKLQDRLSTTVSSLHAGTTNVTAANTANTANATADVSGNARFESWKRAWLIFKKQPILGVGYNFYQYGLRDLGVYSDKTVSTNRSAAGSDSSLLTILATTGVLGLAVFLWFWWRLFTLIWGARKISTLALAMTGVIMAWFASAFFNNTLLYAPIMLPLLLVIGAALADNKR